MRMVRRYLRLLIDRLAATALLIRRMMPWVTGPKQVIVLGDSYTSAYGVTAEQSWAAIYAERLGCSLANLAFEGETSEELVNKPHIWPSGRTQSQLDEALSLIEKARPGNVTAVAIGIGINDWLWLQDPATAERCAVVQTAACDELFAASLRKLGENLNTTLTKLQSVAEPGTHLIVMTYCIVWNADKSDAVNSVILSAVRDHSGVLLADLREPLAGGDLLQDTVHPSVDGHVVIADVFNGVTPQVPDSTPG